MEVWLEPDAGPVHLTGTLDVRSVAQTREVLDAALAYGDGDLVLDLSALDAWDAAGLGLVVAAHRKARRAGRRLVLRGPGPGVLRTLAVTRLHRVLHVERLLPA
jgi:anti-sigma B factor antagonist